MKPPYFLKNLRILRLLFQPIFLISLSFHGVVLMLPAPFDLDKPKPFKKEESVKITDLRTTQVSGNSSPQVSPSPTPQSTPQPSQSDSPQLKEESAKESISKSQKKSKLKSQLETDEVYTDESELSKYEPSKLPTAKTALNTDREREYNTNTDKNKNTDTNRERDTNGERDPDPNTDKTVPTNNTQVKDPIEDFIKNFPFPEESKPGSLEILSQEADGSAHHVAQILDAVIKYYRKSLAAKEYALASPSTDDRDFKIYQVAKGNVRQYLHLISQGDNTVIFLSEKQLSRQNLKNLKSETAEEREFKDILHQMAMKSSSKTLTPEIKTKLGDEKYNDFGMFYGKNPPQLGDESRKAFSDKGFEVKQMFNYRKDLIICYSVQKNSFKGVIQLISTDDSSGTALISMDNFSY